MDRSELDRFGRARFRAGRGHPVLLAVIAKRTLVCQAVFGIAVQDAERTGRHTVGAAVTDILLQVDVAEFVVDQRTRRAGLLAGRLHAMLANIAHHEPPRRMPVAVELLDESYMPPRSG